MSAHWQDFHDTQSHLSHYVYYVGRTKNASDLVPPTVVPASHTSFFHTLATPLMPGEHVYSSVVAYNRAGLSRAGYSNGIVVDSVPPAVTTSPYINTAWVGSEFNTSQQSGSVMRMEWSFADNLRFIHQYFVSVQSDSGSRLPIAPQLVLNADHLSLASLALSDGVSYQVKVIGCDLAGVCASPSPSAAVLVDSSPPIDGYFAVRSDSVANLSQSRTVPGGMTWRNRPNRDLAELNLAFLGFSDVHSGIAEYWAMVGTQLSGSELLPPTLLSPELASGNDTVEILLARVTVARALVVPEVLYVSLWAVNGVGLRSHVVQASFNMTEGEQRNNGSLVLLRSPCALDSCLGHCACAARGALCPLPTSSPHCPALLSSSLPADRIVMVYNVSPQQSSGLAPLFTSITDTLYGRWELMNPSSTAIQRLEWSVGILTDPISPGAGLIDTATQEVWQDAGSAMSAVFKVSEAYPLMEGETYVFYVRAWYSEEEYSIFQSTGVVVNARGPLTVSGRRVRDGTVRSRDMDFSASPSALSMAWDGVFSTLLSGNYTSLDVGIGTVPGSDNIYPLTAIDERELEANISGLMLEEGVAYYSTVRATNPLGETVTSVSDGVVVDTTPPAPGMVLGGRGREYRGTVAQEDTSNFLLRWFGFEDAESAVHHYEAAVTNTTATPTQYTDVGIGLHANLSGLNLIPGQVYYGHVVAVNRAGLRSADTVSGGVAVQEGRPEGRVCQQNGSQILTNPSFENLTIKGVPCPSQSLTVAMATHGWNTDTSYITITTYPQTPFTNLQTPPPMEGCFAVGFIGSISQSFAIVPGHTYQITVSYRYTPLPHHAALRIELPGVNSLHFHPADFTGWSMAHVQFTPQSTTSRILLSSALSYSPVYIDHVTITRCMEYQSLISPDISVTWPSVIHLNHQVIASSKVRLSAQWNIDAMPGGVREFKWALGTVPGGGQLQEYRSTGSTPYATSGELEVVDGEEVHVTVVATSQAGQDIVVHSGSHLVDLTPPYPGSGGVWDGVGEEDVDYQSSPVVGVNWSGLMDSESELKLCSWAIGKKIFL